MGGAKAAVALLQVRARFAAALEHAFLQVLLALQQLLQVGARGLAGGAIQPVPQLLVIVAEARDRGVVVVAFDLAGQSVQQRMQ